MIWNWVEEVVEEAAEAAPKGCGPAAEGRTEPCPSGRGPSHARTGLIRADRARARGLTPAALCGYVQQS